METAEPLLSCTGTLGADAGVKPKPGPAGPDAGPIPIPGIAGPDAGAIPILGPPEMGTGAIPTPKPAPGTGGGAKAAAGEGESAPSGGAFGGKMLPIGGTDMDGKGEIAGVTGMLFLTAITTITILWPL